jgi:hypothetical protein
MGARVIAVVSRIAKKSIEAEPARHHFSEHIACVCVVSVLLPALPQEVRRQRKLSTPSLSLSAVCRSGHGLNEKTQELCCMDTSSCKMLSAAWFVCCLIKNNESSNNEKVSVMGLCLNGATVVSVAFIRCSSGNLFDLPHSATSSAFRKQT